MFAGSEGGARRWAIVASLIETARLAGVEPYAWLRDTLTWMVDGHPNSKLDELLPWIGCQSGDAFQASDIIKNDACAILQRT